MKMMMKKYIGVLLAGVSAVILSSCSDWLTLAPEGGVIREEFWQTKEQLNSAVVGCYCSVQDGPVQKMFLWGELRADMLTNGTSVNNTYNQIIDGEISSSSTVVDWADFYTTINNCNTVLKFAPGVREIDGTLSDKQLKEYEAEALTIRAMMYFYLVRSFRDVPLVLDATLSDNQDYSIPKTLGAAILDTLVRDLKIAAANAPITYDSNEKNKNRVTAWTAKTLLADIYLWQEKYAECNAICSEVIASGKFSLLPVAKDLHYIKDVGGDTIDVLTVPSEADAENMFTKSYVDGRSIESIFEIPFTTQKQNPFYDMMSQARNQLAPKVDIVDGIIFPENKYQYSDAADIRGLGCSFRQGLIWKYVGLSRSGTVRASNNYTAPWIAYKYSDILLMKAEALNQLGLNAASEEQRDSYYTQALACVEQVRSARNATLQPDYDFSATINGKALEKYILEERAREFAFEGKRWYDVLRYAKRGDYAGNNIQYLLNLAVNSASPEKQASLIAKYKDPKHNSHYWPISNQEIEINKELKQNEFYAQ